VCTICQDLVVPEVGGFVLECGHMFHMACLREHGRHAGHASTRCSFTVPCANCRVVTRVEIGTKRPALALEAAPPSKKKKVLAVAGEAAVEPEVVSAPLKKVSAPRDVRIGRWVEVYWAGDGEWFLGRVARQKIMIGGAVQLLVKYHDGATHWESLRDEPYAGASAPLDYSGPWQFRFAETRNAAALPEVGAELEHAALLYERVLDDALDAVVLELPAVDESADVPPPPEF
jgi:hypothetical protein